MDSNDRRIRITNVGYLPSDGETLKGYVKRLQDVKNNIRYGGDNKLHQEKFWCHINPRSSYCWVCDILDMIDYIIEILQDISKEDLKNKWTCFRPTDSHDQLTFTFKPTKKHVAS